MSNIPDNCRYTSDHEWVRTEEDGSVVVGITDFAQSELAELVYVEVETVGEKLDAGEVFGIVEAVKTTSDLFMPLAGEVLAYNEELDSRPELINEDPYGEGWIARIQPRDASAVDELLSAEAYQEEIA